MKIKLLLTPFYEAFMYYFYMLKTIILTISYKLLVFRHAPIVFKLTTNQSVKLLPSGQIAELTYTSSFENDLLNIFSQYIKPSMKIVDVGANIGLYSIVAAKHTGIHGKVWAFEPSKYIIEQLKINMQLNQVNNIVPINYAVAEKNGRLNLVLEKGQKDGYRYLQRNVYAKNEKIIESSSVKVVSIDNYFSKHHSNIDVIKIDVEGGEYNVLRGAQNVIMNNKNLIILLENSGMGLERSLSSQRDLFKILRELNLDVIAWNNALKKWEIKIADVMKAGNIWACKGIGKSRLVEIKF